ncbi:PAS-domain containing protein [Mangrovicoccus sp. HB161399]|uniref:PAS-domain containing protein n=1 Tax=Mangrovicoccus sp. HB161399 TaxID=2720392 RepID=UPI001552A1A6|nr:PAS-domain containing protein [Mangrovicoccus sp. HB161399]
MDFVATGLAMVTVGIASAMAGLMLLRLAAPGGPGAPAVARHPEEEGIVYLFRGRTLIDATGRALGLLSAGQPGSDDWSRFLATYAVRFSRLEQRLADLREGDVVELAESGSGPSAMVMHAERHNGVLRAALCEPVGEERPEQFERYAVQAMEMELDMLRCVAEDSPVLTWRQQQDGTVIWANRAYMAEMQREYGDEALASWPPRQVFPGLDFEAWEEEVPPRRISRATRQGESPRWYELHSRPGDAAKLCFAMPIDQLVQAEASLKDFIGTLGKTFAQLPIGLAIFDAKRRLVLFNPALIDLTALGPEMLTQRPTLHAFLDALRENQRIPEPRDYKSWRLRIARLEAAAEDGRYKETWTLPTGQTYRVTGQPHPDGAVAFLFEDISSEVSLKRRFRSEIDMGHSVLNAFEQAVAVFDPDGTMVLSNAAYGELWDVMPETALARITLGDAFRHWGLGDPRDTLRREIRGFVLGEGARCSFCFRLPGTDGLPVIATLRSLPQRATLVEFRSLCPALAEAKAQQVRDPEPAAPALREARG